jgi:F-type H+-transporting ATPase subunit alpha
LSVPAGDFLFGRVINPLGEAIDGKGPIPAEADKLVPLEPESLGIAKRAFIKDQFETGVAVVDTIIPLGKGQRELLLGDARSGKTGFLLDIVINQKDKDTVCIYGCVGKPPGDVHDLVGTLEREKALGKTIFVVGSSDDTAPLIYLAPKTALALACFFQKQGRDVLLILDDMGSHAKTYREISLLAERTPGREAYPGDIFYEHAHLLERAGSFDPTAGSGSITALPVIELGMTDFTGFISTNIMSMTDGHFLFNNDLYGQGQRPAIDLLLSVSRVGQQTQSHVQTELAFKIKQVLTEAARLASLTSFSAELPPETRLLLARKSLIMEALRQAPSENIPKEKQVILLALPFCPFFESKEEKFLAAFKSAIIEALSANPKLAEFTKNVGQLSGAEELVAKLNELGPEILGAIQKPPAPPPPTTPERIQIEQIQEKPHANNT